MFVILPAVFAIILRGLSGIEAAMEVSPFQGVKFLQLVNCTLTPDRQQVALKIKTQPPKQEKTLITSNAETKECTIHEAFASCQFSKDGGVTVSAVVTEELVQGEEDAVIVCEGTYRDDGSVGVGNLTTPLVTTGRVPNVTVAEQLREKGTEDWITTGPLYGEQKMQVVECKGPKDKLLSMSLFDSEENRLANVNVHGKSCTTSSEFSSCKLNDVDKDVTLKTLVTGLADGETRTFGCQRFTKGDRSTGYVNVTYDAPDTGGAESKCCGVLIHLLALAAACTILHDVIL